jgi:dUTP pyrophosphatase
MLKIKILDPRAKIPTRAFDSAGYDLFPLESGVIIAGEKVNIPLGFATSFSSNYVAIIDDRGSTGNKGLTHLAGVIDADYRGEWILMMMNLGKENFHYSSSKAIAQALFLKVAAFETEIVESLDETTRGDGKLGSSGR